MSFTNRTIFYTLTRDGLLKPGRALELGCGGGYDARRLAEAGFVVDAVDCNAEVLKSLLPTPSINPLLSQIENFSITPNTYNLISSQFVLHFLPKETAHTVISKMVEGAVRGGIISFNILGEKDEWKEKWTTWTREEIEAFLQTLPIKIYKTVTEEGSGMTRAGSIKYWHLREYVLVKE